MNDQLQAMVSSSVLSGMQAGGQSFHTQTVDPHSRNEFERIYYAPSQGAAQVAPAMHSTHSSSLLQNVGAMLDDLAAQQKKIDLMSSMEIKGLTDGKATGPVESAKVYERLLTAQKAINEQAARVQLANSCANGVQGCVQTLVQRGQ